MSGTVILCIGNASRHDDGVAEAVGELARRTLTEPVAVIDLDGEPARVVDAWDGADLAIVVDAARTGAPGGTIRRLEVGSGDVLPATGPVGTHGCSIGDAVDLATALGRLPARIVVYVVEGSDFSPGPGLTDPVARAVPQVVERLVQETAVALDARATGSEAR